MSPHQRTNGNGLRAAAASPDQPRIFAPLVVVGHSVPAPIQQPTSTPVPRLLPSWPGPHEQCDDPTMPSTKNANGDSHFPQRLKNFFRITSGSRDRESTHGHGHGPARSDTKTAFRQTRFFSVGRLRSATTASEGNPLDEALSPTAHANPYFAHQGQPGLRHHNDGSVPPSPPGTPMLKVVGPNGEKPSASTKEEIARKLRRVASAPNAQGLFSKGNGDGERPATAELTKEPLAESKDSGAVGFAETKPNGDGRLAVPESDGLGALPPPSQSPLAFRRTYSSNSIKVRDVEVGPQSFDKIKLIGKGDVGKVYLVREKKSSRLYAMKGKKGPDNRPRCLGRLLTSYRSAEQEGDDQAQQDQEGARRAGDPRDEQSPLHRDALPLFPVRGLPLSMHGVLQRRRVLQGIADASWEVHIRGGCPFLRGRGYGGAGVSASHGFYLPRSEAGE